MMKKIAKRLTMITSIMMILNVATAQPFEQSKNLQPASTLPIAHRTMTDALAANHHNPNIIPLSGNWSMKLYDYAHQADADVQQLAGGWGQTVALPSVWQAQNLAPAIYSAAAYPFLYDKPQPGRFPEPLGKTALYVQQVSIPFDYMDRMVYLTIGGGGSKITLFINGVEVGFATDSKIAAQYDISEHMVRGLNTVALKVEQYSMASWVEDQSGWRTAGPTRDIYIYAQPKIRIRDMINRTKLSDDLGTALLSSALLLKSELINPHTVTVFFELIDPQGNTIRKDSRDVNIGKRREDTIRFNATIRDAQLWNSEMPALYNIVYSIKREGRFTEFVSQKVGLRQVKVQGQKLLINGIAPKIKGVNLAEFDAKEIAVTNPGATLWKLGEMKKAGVNAIRTDGYPLPKYFYEMTDSLGFFVLNVANLSTTGLENHIHKGKSLANDPQWLPVFMQRITAAYELTKNNPSVIGLALGQQAGNGYNMYQARMELKMRDPDLVVFYDHEGFEWNADVVTPINPTYDEILKIDYTRYAQPIIPAKASLEQYQLWLSDVTQGAFVQRWESHSLLNPQIGRALQLNDNYTETDLPLGILYQNSATEQIEILEQLFANIDVKITDREKGVAQITNLMYYMDLYNFPAQYRVLRDGEPGPWKTILVTCPKNQTTQITLEPINLIRTIELKFGNFFFTTLR